MSRLKWYTHLKHIILFRIYLFLKWTHDRWPPKEPHFACVFCIEDEIMRKIQDQEDLPLEHQDG